MCTGTGWLHNYNYCTTCAMMEFSVLPSTAPQHMHGNNSEQFKGIICQSRLMPKEWRLLWTIYRWKLKMTLNQSIIEISIGYFINPYITRWSHPQPRWRPRSSWGTSTLCCAWRGKTAIVDRFAAMPSVEMTRTCSRFRSMIEAIFEAEGDFIEWMKCLFLTDWKTF